METTEICPKCNNEHGIACDKCHNCGHDYLKEFDAPISEAKKTAEEKAIADPNGAQVQRSGDYLTIVRTGDSEIEINSIDKEISERTAEIIVNALNSSQSNTNILQELEGLRERVNLHNDMLHGYIQRHLLLEEIDKIISNHKTK